MTVSGSPAPPSGNGPAAWTRATSLRPALPPPTRAQLAPHECGAAIPLPPRVHSTLWSSSSPWSPSLSRVTCGGSFALFSCLSRGVSQEPSRTEGGSSRVAGPERVRRGSTGRGGAGAHGPSPCRREPCPVSSLRNQSPGSAPSQPGPHWALPTPNQDRAPGDIGVPCFRQLVTGWACGW